MKILADENLARDLVAWLRASGHDVLYAAEASPGESDPTWATRAEQEERILLTSDKDFGELVFRDGRSSYGVVLLRLDHLTVSEALARLRSVWSVVVANPSSSRKRRSAFVRSPPLLAIPRNTRKSRCREKRDIEYCNCRPGTSSGGDR